MQDVFTGCPTCIRGRILPGEPERTTLQNDHRRRLAALDDLGTAAAECGLRADSDRDLVLLAEDEVSLLEGVGRPWMAFGTAIRALRACLPIRSLEDFGFASEAESPLEEPNLRLRRIGGGVEAWVFASLEDASVYKFYLPRQEKKIGSEFGFHLGEETMLLAEARLGNYRGLFEKLWLIHVLGGMATEIIAITVEGILIAKQTLGDVLPQGDDVSAVLPVQLVEIPSRFLRADRDHPRLLFAADRPFLVADLHARNFVRDEAGELRVIDLVAAPWPVEVTARDPLVTHWLQRVFVDPKTDLLESARDEEL